jgi:hypothetical protein
MKGPFPVAIGLEYHQKEPQAFFLVPIIQVRIDFGVLIVVLISRSGFGPAADDTSQGFLKGSFCFWELCGIILRVKYCTPFDSKFSA